MSNKIKITLSVVFVIMSMVIVAASLSACNVDLVDTVFHYDYAIIKLPDGEIIEGKVQSWRDYEDGDQLQICIDGKTYLVHSMNATLIEEGET